MGLCWSAAGIVFLVLMQGVGLVVSPLGMAHSLQWLLGWAAAASGALGALGTQWTSLFWSRISPELPREDLGLPQRMQCGIPIVTGNILLNYLIIIFIL